MNWCSAASTAQNDSLCSKLVKVGVAIRNRASLRLRVGVSYWWAHAVIQQMPTSDRSSIPKS